jgi:DNA replication initiation complex subunit (GINS family)
VELWGVGHMTDNISYDYLWQAYQKERQTNQLLLVPRTFYEDALEFINKAKASKDIDQSIVDNATKILSEFYEKRKQKILIYIAYNRQLPQPISNSELEFYNKMLQVVKSERLDLIKQTKAISTHALKSLKELPEIILPSGSKLGPLKIDQIIETLNEQDRSYLIDNTICEQIY